jgi:GNAT superfamily N-acetyltransferase
LKYLKRATWDDYDEILAMAMDFAGTYYKFLPVEEWKVAETITKYLNDDGTSAVIVLAMDHDKTLGMIGGVKTPLVFNEGFVAQETIWWMKPGHRNSGVSLKLIEAFELWAEKIDADIVQLCSVESEYAERVAKIYKYHGYQHIENTFIKRRK